MDLKKLKDTPPWEWPQSAAKLLHKVLTDERAEESDRRMAAELAGDLVVINDELAEALLTLIRDAAQSEKLRATAAVALGAVLEQSDIDGFEDPAGETAISARTFHRLQEWLHILYLDVTVAKEVRRRILESSVRAPQDWHAEAIRAAYASEDREWKRTAVFAMRWIRGFDTQILQALESGDPAIHHEAVHAAGEWEIAGAWPHVSALVSAPGSKRLLLAAIAAVGSIRPKEAAALLAELRNSEDEDIVDAVDEALLLADASPHFDAGYEEEGEQTPPRRWIN